MDNSTKNSNVEIQVENIQKVVSQFDYRDQAEKSGQLAEGGSGESTSDGEGAE